MQKILNLRFLRIMSLIVLLVGAIASLDRMLYTGRNQSSVLLILLFSGWVLSPFIGLMVADIIFRRWQIPSRLILYTLMLFITPVSIVSYCGAFNPPGMKPAAVYLLVPLFSWLLIIIVLLPASRLSRKLTRKNDIG